MPEIKESELFHRMWVSVTPSRRGLVLSFMVDFVSVHLVFEMNHFHFIIVFHLITVGYCSLLKTLIKLPIQIIARPN